MSDKVNKEDLKHIAQWLNTQVENVNIEYTKESMDLYRQDAIDMLKSYDEFPKDKKRTDKIIRLLKKGESSLPMYVAKNDHNNFVMEGRHRMVAFYLLGYQEVLVARVEVKKKPSI